MAEPCPMLEREWCLWRKMELLAILLNRWSLIKLGLAQKPCREREKPEAEISRTSELAFVSSGLWMTPVGNKIWQGMCREGRGGMREQDFHLLVIASYLVYCISGCWEFGYVKIMCIPKAGSLLVETIIMTNGSQLRDCVYPDSSMLGEKQTSWNWSECK